MTALENQAHAPEGRSEKDVAEPKIQRGDAENAQAGHAGGKLDACAHDGPQVMALSTDVWALDEEREPEGVVGGSTEEGEPASTEREVSVWALTKRAVLEGKQVVTIALDSGSFINVISSKAPPSMTKDMQPTQLRITTASGDTIPARGVTHAQFDLDVVHR